MNYRKGVIPCIITTLLLFSYCKDDTPDRVPNVPVNLVIDLNLPANNALVIVGGWAYAAGGSEGIIIYRESPDQFRAFDRHCTWEVGNFDRIEVDSTNVFATDVAGCGSRFIITDGSAIQDPAFVPLTEYQTNYNPATNRVTITN